MAIQSIVVALIAEFTHEINRAYCHGIGDDSQPAWADAPQWQKDSAFAGVTGILDGSIKTPADSHESWFAQKVADGWKYGPVKDPEKKEHPCMVPYLDLPQAQRVKDDLFRTTVLQCARILGEPVAA